MTLPNLHVEDDAIEFVRDRGCRLYLWSSDGGPMFDFLHADVEPPDGVRFDRIRQDGLEIFLEESLIAEPWEMLVHVARFPMRHLVLINKWSATDGGGGDIGGGDGGGC